MCGGGGANQHEEVMEQAGTNRQTRGSGSLSHYVNGNPANKRRTLSSYFGRILRTSRTSAAKGDSSTADNQMCDTVDLLPNTSYLLFCGMSGFALWEPTVPGRIRTAQKQSVGVALVSLGLATWSRSV